MTGQQCLLEREKTRFGGLFREEELTQVICSASPQVIQRDMGIVQRARRRREEWVGAAILELHAKTRHPLTRLDNEPSRMRAKQHRRRKRLHPAQVLLDRGSYSVATKINPERWLPCRQRALKLIRLFAILIQPEAIHIRG